MYSISVATPIHPFIAHSAVSRLAIPIRYSQDSDLGLFQRMKMLNELIIRYQKRRYLLANKFR